MNIIVYNVYLVLSTCKTFYNTLLIVCQCIFNYYILLYSKSIFSPDTFVKSRPTGEDRGPLPMEAAEKTGFRHSPE